MSILQNVQIDEFKTFDDWGLILKKKTITSATPKIEQVEVPARNGVIDMTYVVSDELKYSNRTITMNFILKDYVFEKVDAFVSMIQSAIQGKDVKIQFENDIEYFWQGRIKVTNTSNGKGVNPKVEITMVADVFPFRFSEVSSMDEWEWDTFDFENDVVKNMKDILVAPSASFDFYADKYNTAPNIIVSETTGTVKVTIWYWGIGKQEEPILVIDSEELFVGDNTLYDWDVKEGVYQIDLWVERHNSALVSIDTRGGSL